MPCADGADPSGLRNLGSDASRGQEERADCLGHPALVKALRGQRCRATELGANHIHVRAALDTWGRLLTWLSKEQEDEIHEALHGPGNSMSGVLAAGNEPGIGPTERLPAALVTRCPLRLRPSVKALRGAAAASRSERP